MLFRCQLFVAFWRLVFLSSFLSFCVGIYAEEPRIPSIEELTIHPQQISLTGLDKEHAFIVTGRSRNGEMMDVTEDVEISVNPPGVIAVSSNNTVRALTDGKAELKVKLGRKQAKLLVNATNAGHSITPSFKQDVLPVLTKTGCNSGGCHGKLAGQNGFRLSLRGYAPEWDFAWLTSEFRSRRIDYAFPEESLLVRKPIGKTPHEGGKRFEEGTRYYQALVDWIAARAPGPVDAEKDAERLEVLPGNRVTRPGDYQQLLVIAHYANGRKRDVTWLAQFFSNDETTVSVTESGLAKSLRAGETSIRIHFQGLVEVVRFTIPFDYQVARRHFSPRNNAIDEHLFAKLKALQIPPSLDCGDEVFIRRAFLDATGTLPNPERVRQFMSDKRRDKRARLVDELLVSDAFVDFWTLQLSDLLQNRKERDHDVRGVKGVRAFHAWLRSEVAAGKSWDSIAREVLNARGDSVTEPQIGYFITTIGEKDRPEESEVADSVAQAFLGTRIGCAKCHNHPLERYTQDDYYHFSAFFSKISLKRESPEQGRTELRFGGKDVRDQERHMENLQRDIEKLQEKLAKESEKKEEHEKRIAEKKKELEHARQELDKRRLKPAAVEQPRTKQRLKPQPLDRSTPDIDPQADPREKLVEWLTDPSNEYFSGAMVNRLWRHYMGVGLVEPVDDLRASNPPTNPQLWSYLNKEFIGSGYDLRHMMRLILNSRAYQLSSETLKENETDTKFYSHYYARRLPAEVMLDAVSSATEVPDQFDGYPIGMRAVQLPEPGVNSYFLSLFGRSDRVTACACERRGDVTLPQLLNLQNGEELNQKLRHPEGRLQKLLTNTDDQSVLREIFMATVNRLPKERERQAVDEALQRGDKREEVFQDLFWALLNSKEFVFNH